MSFLVEAPHSMKFEFVLWECKTTVFKLSDVLINKFILRLAIYLVWHDSISTSFECKKLRRVDVKYTPSEDSSEIWNQVCFNFQFNLRCLFSSDHSSLIYEVNWSSYGFRLLAILTDFSDFFIGEFSGLFSSFHRSRVIFVPNHLSIYDISTLASIL